MQKFRLFVPSIRNFKKFMLIMKLFTLILFISLATASAKTSYSQSAKFTLNLERVTVGELFDRIERSSEFIFVYYDNIIDLNRELSVNANNETVEEILEKAFKSSGNTFKVFDRQIVIAKKESSAADLEAILTQQQQKKQLSGTIKDSKGLSLPGVSIIVKGTTTGTITDTNGQFIFDVPTDAQTLVFSFMGMKTQEISVAGKRTFSVVLQEETIGLDEVVAIGYGVQKKASLTGAISSLKSEDLLKQPVANTTQLLIGTVPGLFTKQSSGIPGDDGTVLNIRGFSNSPLVLIDGLEGDFSDIDPNDIESISILKDASAAVYGARAGNGVILVTTKRGSEKAPRITYNGNFSFTQPTFLPDRVGAAKWAELLNETGLDVNQYLPNYVVYDKVNNKLTNSKDGSLFNGYNWSKEIMRDWTPQQQHNLSVTGGNQNTKYFISGGFTDQASNFKSGDYNFNRYNIRSNLDVKINDNLGISIDFSYQTQILDKAAFTLAGMYNNLPTAKPVYPVVHENDPSRASYPGFLGSPYSQTFKEFSGSTLTRINVIQSAIEVKYSFPMIKGLAAKARITFEETFGWDKNISKPYTIWEYDPTASTTEGEWINRGIMGNPGSVKVNTDRSSNILPLVSLEYEKKISDHSLKAMIAGESRKYQSADLMGKRINLISFEAPYLRYASQIGIENDEIADEKARTGIIGRINYDYKGKYLLELAMRADASAEYPKEGRWGFFPSISAGWRISEESFIQDNFKAVDNLKLRASYGVLGYDAASSFAYLTGYLVEPEYYVFGNTPAPIISSTGLSNPNITWEKMTLYNIGLDGKLWNGLFGFEFDAFYRLREGILAIPIANIPGTFGSALPLTNMNSRDNRGFEILLSHKNTIGKFFYEISPMISWSRGKYVKWQEDVSTDPEWNAMNIKKGQWDDRVWGYVSDGLFKNEDEIANDPVDQSYNGDDIKNNDVFVGDIIYKDLNNDGKIDWHDQKVIGTSGLPKTMYSLRLNAQYKGFGVDMLFQGGGNYSVSFTGSVAAPFSNESIPLEEHYRYRAIVALDDQGKKYITNTDAKLPPVFQSGLTPK